MALGTLCTGHKQLILSERGGKRINTAGRKLNSPGNTNVVPNPKQYAYTIRAVINNGPEVATELETTCVTVCAARAACRQHRH